MRNIFIIIFTFLCFSLAAQQKISEQYVGWRGGGLQLHSISNKELSCTFILGLDSIKAFVFNNSAIIQEFTIHRRGPTEKFLGGFIRDSNVYLYMDNAENPGLHTWLLNIADKSVKENIVPFKTKRDKVISHLSSDNHFFFLTISKSTYQFVIYDFKDESHYDTAQYGTKTDMWDILSGNTTSLTPDAEITDVNTGAETNIDIVQSLNKTYIRNDSLFLLSNRSKSITSIYEFDLDNKKMTTRLIKHNPTGIHEWEGVNNSFLLENKLYYVSATPKRLVLQVVDFYSGNILKEFMASADSDINFSNTAIWQESGRIGGNRELSKTKQLLRKITNGRAVIVAYKDEQNKQVQLFVGSYIYNSGAYNMTGEWSKSAGFKTLLDLETNEHIIGELPPNINDKIEAYSKGIKTPEQGVNLFSQNAGYYYVFYNKDKRSFNIARF